MTKPVVHAPRRMHTSEEALLDTELASHPPAPDSITGKLWSNSLTIAQQALASDFVQGIAKGTLNPDQYGGYTIQDCAYCFNARKDYQTLIDRAVALKEEAMARFAQARQAGYKKYNKNYFQQWHLNNPDALTPGPAAESYIAFECWVIHNLPPIYGIIAMIPCEQLWSWLAKELEPDIKPGNVYDYWIQENSGKSGAYRLENFVNDWLAKHDSYYSPEWALYVFQSCMIGEVNFFRSGTGQPLLPMPARPSSPLPAAK